MKYLFIVYSLLCSIIADDMQIQSERIHADDSLIIPGYGAEKIVLKDSIAKINSLYQGNRFTKSNLKNENELFKDVFNIDSSIKIYFDAIYHNSNTNSIFFIKKNHVEAIAGLNNNRITIDFVELRKGANYFIFNYGNHSLMKINTGKDIIYMYPSKGIAIFDEKDNDQIDMFLIFPAIR